MLLNMHHSSILLPFWGPLDHVWTLRLVIQALSLSPVRTHKQPHGTESQCLDSIWLKHTSLTSHLRLLTRQAHWLEIITRIQPLAHLNHHTAAAHHLAGFALSVDLAQTDPLTKLLVVIYL